MLYVSFSANDGSCRGHAFSSINQSVSVLSTLSALSVLFALAVSTNPSLAPCMDRACHFRLRYSSSPSIIPIHCLCTNNIAIQPVLFDIPQSSPSHFVPIRQLFLSRRIPEGTAGDSPWKWRAFCHQFHILDFYRIPPSEGDHSPTMTIWHMAILNPISRYRCREWRIITASNPPSRVRGWRIFSSSRMMTWKLVALVPGSHALFTAKLSIDWNRWPRVKIL